MRIKFKTKIANMLINFTYWFINAKRIRITYKKEVK